MSGTGNDRSRAKPLSFPFHYGGEAQTHSFYKIPKILFTSDIFDCLSTDAKLLYGILLDRMQLSVKNGWFDEEGRVYIYFRRETVMEALTCGNKKAGQLMAELDDKSGIGLITRVRQGQGKPDRIYVHKCAIPEIMPRYTRLSSEVSYGNIQKCPNDTSGSVETTPLDVSKTPPNNTEKNKPERSETDQIGSNPETEALAREYDSFRAYFEEQCSLKYLRREYPTRVETIDEIRELLTDVCCSKKPFIRIGGDDKPAQVVRSVFMKLNCGHIRYVMNCFTSNSTKVRNIRQYLLTSLYNASMTIDSYYTAEANHDVYGQD